MLAMKLNIWNGIFLYLLFVIDDFFEKNCIPEMEKIKNLLEIVIYTGIYKLLLLTFKNGKEKIRILSMRTHRAIYR